MTENVRWTQEEVNRFSKMIGKAITNHVKPLKKCIAELEKRIEQLEKIPHLKYIGVFSPQTKYVENNVVTHQGCMWVCKVRETSSWPGGSDGCWQLAVMRGKPAKELVSI